MHNMAAEFIKIQKGGTESGLVLCKKASICVECRLCGSGRTNYGVYLPFPGRGELPSLTRQLIS